MNNAELSYALNAGFSYFTNGRENIEKLIDWWHNANEKGLATSGELTVIYAPGNDKYTGILCGYAAPYNTRAIMDEKIPIPLVQCTQEPEWDRCIEESKKAITSEFRKAESDAAGKLPLVITEDMNYNEAAAYCPINQKKYFLFGFRTFKKDFMIQDGLTDDELEPKDCHIHILSDETCDILGLFAKKRRFNKRTEYDKWYYKKPRPLTEEILSAMPTRLATAYRRAVILLNRYYGYEHEYSENMWHLENAVESIDILTEKGILMPNTPFALWENSYKVLTDCIKNTKIV